MYDIWLLGSRNRMSPRRRDKPGRWRGARPTRWNHAQDACPWRDAKAGSFNRLWRRSVCTRSPRTRSPIDRLSASWLTPSAARKLATVGGRPHHRVEGSRQRPHRGQHRAEFRFAAMRPTCSREKPSFFALLAAVPCGSPRAPFRALQDVGCAASRSPCHLRIAARRRHNPWPARRAATGRAGRQNTTFASDGPERRQRSLWCSPTAA